MKICKISRNVPIALIPAQLSATGVGALASALMVALYGAFLFGATKGVTLETIAASGRAAVTLEGHFRWIFAAAALCLAISWLFLLAMEERPPRTHAAREGEPARRAGGVRRLENSAHSHDGAAPTLN